MINRKIHRWLSVVGILFFLSVSLTGVWMQGEAIFGEDEAAREAMAEIVSPVSLSAPLQSFSPDMAIALSLRSIGSSRLQFRPLCFISTARSRSR
jgi:hypothetical protein